VVGNTKPTATPVEGLHIENSKRFCSREWLEKSMLYTHVLFQFLCG
jgi:hypothetical protein